MDRESIKKLEKIIESRFNRFWAESDSKSSNDTLRIVGEWHAYVCSIGMHLSRLVGNQGLYLTCPSSVVTVRRMIDRADYLVVPEELALRILVMGRLP